MLDHDVVVLVPRQARTDLVDGVVVGVVALLGEVGLLCLLLLLEVGPEGDAHVAVAEEQHQERDDEAGDRVPCHVGLFLGEAE